MYEFTFYRPRSLEAAVELLGELGDTGKIVSGGQSLIPALKQRLAAPSALVDVTRLPQMKAMDAADGRIRFGAATVYADIAQSPLVAIHAPAIAYLAGIIADPLVRNRGTVGGSLSNNDPSADFPAAALALGAEILTTKRRLPYASFIDGLFTTVLEPDEIVINIAFPLPARAGYEKIRHPASRYAMSGVFAADLDGEWRVAVTGAGRDGVFRLTSVEAMLNKAAVIPELADIDINTPLMSDITVAADYRGQLVRVAAQRAIAKALSTAKSYRLH